MKTKTPSPTATRRFVRRKHIAPDPQQPRKAFDTESLQQLADSFGGDQEGVLECLKVIDKGGGRFQLIDGERRWRAAALAGLEWLPIEVIAPKDVLKTQLIFGTQRENLNALEQATGAARLLEQRRKTNPKFSVADLGLELGHKRATMYELLALLKISAPVRAALEAGQLDASKARLFATVPVAAHKELLRQATQVDGYDGSTLSVRQLSERIAKNYSRQLSAAPWKLDDDRLLKSAGPCTTCPKRSGNIEGMGGSPNVCTDVACFAAKQATHTAEVLAAAKAGGQRIIAPEKFRNSYDYQAADEKCYKDDKQRTWKVLANAAAIAPAIAVNREGQAIEVFTPDDKAAICKANKIAASRSSSPGRSPADKAHEKKEKQYRGAALRAAPLLLEKLISKTGTVRDGLWPRLAEAAYHALDITKHDFVAKRRGLSKTVNESRPALEKWFKAKHTTAEYVAVTVELLLCANWHGGGWGKTEWAQGFKALARLAGVNLDKQLAAVAKSKTPNPPTKKGKKK